MHVDVSQFVSQLMLTLSFDGKDSDELTIEQIVHGPPEYSQWESRNSR